MATIKAPQNPRRLAEVQDAAIIAFAATRDAAESWASLRLRLAGQLTEKLVRAGLDPRRAASRAEVLLSRIAEVSRFLEDATVGLERLATATAEVDSVVRRNRGESGFIS